MYFTYLAINLLTIAGPLLLSFDPRIGFYRLWGTALLAIIPVACVFLTWDALFTQAGVWSFNERYTLGITLLGMPLEEWMFFVAIPFACLFIHETVRYFCPVLWQMRVPRLYVVAPVACFIALAVVFWQFSYTRVCCLAASCALLAHWTVFGGRYMAGVFATYLIHLLPFCIVNGILTALPVVSYNDQENLGIRIGTIPIEDTVYSLALLLGVFTIFELLRRKKVLLLALAFISLPGLGHALDFDALLADKEVIRARISEKHLVADELELARRNFYLSVQDEDYIEEALEQFDTVRKLGVDENLVDMYEAAIHALRAKHAFWPVRKINLANEAIEKMDLILKRANLDFETRFVYASTVHYLPSFFGKSEDADSYTQQLGREFPTQKNRFPLKLYINIGEFLLDSDRLDQDAAKLVQAALDLAKHGEEHTQAGSS